MRFWFIIRFMVARFTFFALRLSVFKIERDVSEFWKLTQAERIRRLDEILRINSPKGANGRSVNTVEEIAEHSPLTKSAFREMFRGTENTVSEYSRHTAGTTGDPTNVILSREELARMLAVRSYCYNKHGIRLGEREARVWGRAANTPMVKIRDFLLNRRVFYPAESDAEDTVEKLVKWHPEYIYGYTSLILEAAQIVKKKGLQPYGVKAVICTAESILPAQKKFIAEAFGAPVLEEYGSTEFDVIAFECSSGHLHLVNPWLWVEVEDGSALITDTVRASQNFVRYQLGDSIGMVNSDCGELGSTWTIDELRGRTVQQFAYVNPDQKFHAVVFSRALNAYMDRTGDCFRFTIIQTGYGEFQVYVSNIPSLDREDLEAFLKSDLQSRLLLREHFKIQVEVHEGGMGEGKHTYFIQNI